MNLFEPKLRKCTMQSATHFCRLPGRYGYKWPALQALHRKRFNQTFEGAHQALAGVAPLGDAALLGDAAPLDGAALLPGVEVKAGPFEMAQRARRGRFNRLRGLV